MTVLCVWLIAGLAALGEIALSADDNWPKFRGQGAGVVDDDPALPDSWSDSENVVWKLDVPGLGWSSPIVWGDYVFVISAISATKETTPKPGLDLGEGQGYVLGNAKDPTSSVRRQWLLYAVDFNTGKIRWKRELRSAVPVEAKQLKNSYASETPVTDGKRVYVYLGSAHALFAVDFSGRLVWSTEVKQPDIRPDLIPAASGPPFSGDLLNMGTAASPALHNDRLYIVSDHKGPPQDARHDVGEWFLASFDARSGREVWRAHHVKKDDSYGWSTPFIWENGLRTEIITVSDNHVRSFDPDGRLLWALKGTSRNSTPTPFAAHGLLYVSSGFPGARRPVYAIRPGAGGDISLKNGETTNEYVVWSDRQLASYMPSPLVYGDYFYTLHSLGLLQCNDARTGKPVYGRQRIAEGAGTFTASPWAYNGRIFALSEDGDTYVIQAGPEFKVLRKNSLREMTLATPAIMRGSVIIRTVSSLWRIAKRAGR
jgi:outer membrane protein assembly factor BamB